jgi:hypothetical protein
MRLVRRRPRSPQRPAPDIGEIGKFAQQFSDHGFGPAAVKAFEVAVLHHGHGRVEGAPDVVDLGMERLGEVDQVDRVTEHGADVGALRQGVQRPEHGRGQQRGRHDGGQDAELRLLEQLPVERERGDQKRDGEPDASRRPGAGHGPPADRWPQASAGQPGHQIRGDSDRERLADQVPDHDSERDRGMDGRPQRRTGDRNTCVGQSEQGDDEVARPWQPQGGQPVVRRHRGRETGAGASGERTRGLLPKPAELGAVVFLAESADRGQQRRSGSAP